MFCVFSCGHKSILLVSKIARDPGSRFCIGQNIAPPSTKAENLPQGRCFCLLYSRRDIRSRTVFDSVEPKTFSTLLARPILLNGCPCSPSSPSGSIQKYRHRTLLVRFVIFVLPEGLEPPTAASKADMISVSPREQSFPPILRHTG